MNRSGTVIARRDLNSPLIQSLMLLLLGGLSYCNTFTVPLHYDDYTALRKTVSAPFRLGLESGPRWVTDLSFHLNRVAHGEWVAGYHLVNLTIHLAAALCLYACIRAAVASLLPPPTDGTPEDGAEALTAYIPFATAALFVCHPVQTQAVTYIAQRYTSLATLFYLAGMLTFIKARLSSPQSLTTRSILWGAASLLLTLLAMMSKEIAFTLPLMLVLLEIMLFRGRLLKAPPFIAAVIGLTLVIPLQLLLFSGAGRSGNLLQGLQSVTTEVQTISRGDYFLTELRVIATYLRLMLLPVNQNLDYDYPLYRSVSEFPVLASLALHLALLALAFIMFRRSRIYLQHGEGTRGIALRLGSLGICWFYLALLVESSFIPIRDVITEHRLYLPSGGIILLATAMAGSMAARRPDLRKVVRGVTLLCCLALMTASIARNGIWNNEMMMWQDVLAKSPGKARAHFNAGFYLAKRSQLAQGLPHLVRALELDPSPQLYWITVNSAVASLYSFRGRSSDGMQYQTTIESPQPGLVRQWQAAGRNNLGLAYEHLGDLKQARIAFAMAASIDPGLDLAWFNLAVICARQNDRPAFETARARLTALNPERAARLSPLMPPP